MSSLDSYLQKWSLSEPCLLAQTVTSHVYTVSFEDATVVLKLLTPLGIKDERNGAVALQHFNGNGAVRLLNHDDGAHLLEYVAGDDLIPMVKRGDDVQATQIIAATIKQLHTQPSEIPSTLTPLKYWFRGLILKAKQDEADSILRHGACVAEQLLASPQEECVLHGDIHHENIRHSEERGWLLIDPKGLYGERTYDVANTFCNPMGFPEIVENETRLLNTARIFSDVLAIDEQRILAFVFAYACLSAAWSLEAGQDASRALSIAVLVEPHINI